MTLPTTLSTKTSCAGNTFRLYLSDYGKFTLASTGSLYHSIEKFGLLYKDCLNLCTLNSIFISNEGLIICKNDELSESIFFILAGLILILVFNRLKKPIEYF